MMDTEPHSPSDTSPYSSSPIESTPPSISTPQSTTTTSTEINYTIDRPDFFIKAPPTPSNFPITLGTLIAILPHPSSPSRGNGIFALRDIPAGTTIIFESPLLIVPVPLSQHQPHPDPLDDMVEALGEREKRVWKEELCQYRREEWESANRGVLWSNGYEVYDREATGVFEVAARVNHACVPNCRFEWRWMEKKAGGDGDERRGGLMIWNAWKILEGEEITVDYGHHGKDRRDWYGFVCQCGACTDDGGSDEVERRGVAGTFQTEEVVKSGQQVGKQQIAL